MTSKSPDNKSKIPVKNEMLDAVKVLMLLFNQILQCSILLFIIYTVLSCVKLYELYYVCNCAQSVYYATCVSWKTIISSLGGSRLFYCIQMSSDRS